MPPVTTGREGEGTEAREICDGLGADMSTR